MYDKIDNIYLALIERRKLVKRKTYYEECLLMGWKDKRVANMYLSTIKYRLTRIDERMRELNHG